jgi:hypothetical protein
LKAYPTLPVKTIVFATDWARSKKPQQANPLRLCKTIEFITAWVRWPNPSVQVLAWGLGEAGALLELPPELPAPILGASPQADNSSKALVTAAAPIRGNVRFANCWNLIVIDKPFWYCAQNRSGNI